MKDLALLLAPALDKLPAETNGGAKVTYAIGKRPSIQKDDQVCLFVMATAKRYIAGGDHYDDGPDGDLWETVETEREIMLGTQDQVLEAVTEMGATGFLEEPAYRLRKMVDSDLED